MYSSRPTLWRHEYKRFIGGAYKHNVKYAVIFELIAHTRLKINEVLGLTVNDVDFSNRRIKSIQLPQGAWSRILPYLKQESSEREKLFPISYKRVQIVFNSVCKKTGLHPDYTPYSLRHILAKNDIAISGRRIALSK